MVTDIRFLQNPLRHTAEIVLLVCALAMSPLSWGQDPTATDADTDIAEADASEEAVEEQSNDEVTSTESDVEDTADDSAIAETKDEETENGDETDESDESDFDVFVPTENLSEDASAIFPVNI